MTSVQIRFAFLLLPLQVSIAMAATPYEDSIPLDVAEALFDFANSGNFSVYSDIVSDFPEFQIPPDFEVLGSTITNQMMRVALGTGLDADNALEAITSSFLGNGWISMPVFNPVRQDRGFVFPNQAEPQIRQLCHDQAGQVSISFRRREPQNFVVLTKAQVSGRNRGSCAQLIAQQERSMGMMMGQRGSIQYMPRLVVPNMVDTRSVPGWVLGGISGSSRSADSEATIESELDLEGVYRHFAAQLAEQGWALDTESIGSVGANGIWTRSPEAELDLVAHFNVVSTEESRYELTIRVESTGGGSGGLQSIRVN